MSIADALSAYFSAEQIALFQIAGDTAVAGDASFEMVGGRLKVARVPDDEWLKEQVEKLPPDLAVWELAAFLKVRRFDTQETIVDRARSGDLYDQDYYTKRGGGGPYTDYPHEGSDLNAPQAQRLFNQFRPLAEEIVSALAPDDLLDVGCATGILVKLLQERGINAKGADISKWAVENGLTHDLYHADARKLPFAANSFDVIISQDFVEHVDKDDLEAVFAEQIRIAKPGAKLVHFIPFEPYDEPVALDAHLTNANRKWWMARLQGIPNLNLVSIPDETDQWGPGPQLPRYFQFQIIK